MFHLQNCLLNRNFSTFSKFQTQHNRIRTLFSIIFNCLNINSYSCIFRKHFFWQAYSNGFRILLLDFALRQVDVDFPVCLRPFDVLPFDETLDSLLDNDWRRQEPVAQLLNDLGNELEK